MLVWRVVFFVRPRDQLLGSAERAALVLFDIVAYKVRLLAQ